MINRNSCGNSIESVEAMYKNLSTEVNEIESLIFYRLDAEKDVITKIELLERISYAMAEIHFAQKITGSLFTSMFCALEHQAEEIRIKIAYHLNLVAERARINMMKWTEGSPKISEDDIHFRRKFIVRIASQDWGEIIFLGIPVYYTVDKNTPTEIYFVETSSEDGEEKVLQRYLRYDVTHYIRVPEVPDLDEE